MRKPRRSLCTGFHDLAGGRRGLLCELLPLNDHLDVVFLQSALIIVAPPHGPLVFTSKPEVFACRAGRRALVALFSSQSACVASYGASVSRVNSRTRRQ